MPELVHVRVVPAVVERRVTRAVLVPHRLVDDLPERRGRTRVEPPHRGPDVFRRLARRQAVIERRVRNALESGYPRERLEVIVASDGSDDGTDDIVRAYAGRGVRLLTPGRVGKAEALNAGDRALDLQISPCADRWQLQGQVFAPRLFCLQPGSS